MATALAVQQFESLFAFPNLNHRIFPRCEHGVYLAGARENAPYCTVCTNCAGPQFATRVVHLPRSSSDPLQSPELRANKNQPGTCPACSSVIYCELPNGKHKCADCGEVYDAPDRRLR